MSTFGFVLSMVVLILLMVLSVIVGYLLLEGLRTVPWIRTPSCVSRRMLELAGFQPGNRVVDLGSGDGSIVFEAVAMGGQGIGMERLGLLVRYARLRSWAKGVRGRAEFFQGDILADPLPSGAVVTCYLFSEVNVKLEPRLQKFFPAGTKVVSRDFRFPTLKLIESQPCGRATLHVYEI